jgi:uncharacterized protein (TIGR00251 family)
MQLKIAVAAPPENNKANQRLIKSLAKWFGVSKQQIRLVRGQTSRQKTLEIESPSLLPPAAMLKQPAGG